MATFDKNYLKILTELLPGRPLSSAELAALGISADLANYYVRAGWLQRLGRGVYQRPGAPLERDASLCLLERQWPSLHVGGRTALDWHGIRHYLREGALQLYGWESVTLPPWFVAAFPADYHRKRLFRETPDAGLAISPFQNLPDAPRVAEPERALLEMLSEVGVRQTLAEARSLMESAYTLREEVLLALLRACTQVKTVRLCRRLSQELALPFAGALQDADLPAGSARPWVAPSPEGWLVLKA
jgi:hypothetical protein